MIESRGNLPGSFTESGLASCSLLPGGLRGSLRRPFGVFLFGSAVTGGLSVFMHLHQQELVAISLGFASGLQLFASGYYLGRLKSRN